MTSPKATPRQHHEIPNPIIVDAGSQFHAGYTLLRKAPPQSGVLLPTLQSASVAMELYLKALSAREVEVQESPLSQVVTIYAKAATRSHDPKRLLGLAAPAARTIVEEEFRNRDRLARFATVEEALEAHAKLFTSSRYSYEQDSSFDGVTMEGLDQILDALSDAIRRMPTTFVK